MDLVLPGDKLGVIEEYLASEGAYSDSRGIVRSKHIGYPRYNIEEHIVKVKPLRIGVLPKLGDTVYARIVEIRGEVLAICKIYQVEEKAPLNTAFTGLLHISEITTTMPLKTIYDAVRIGDYIRARIIKAGIPYLISIKGLEYGVILAFCGQCLSPLIPLNNMLLCRKCRRKERRKIAFKHYIRRL